MKDQVRRETYYWPLRPNGAWGVAAFVFLWGVGFGSAILMAPLGIGLLFGVIGWGAALGVVVGALRSLKGARRGVRIDPDGLTLLHWLEPDRHYPWAAVRDIRIGSGTATVFTDSGELRLDAGLSRWLRLARRIEAALGRGAEEQAEGEFVRPEELAGWLGIQPGEELQVRPNSGGPASLLLLVPAWLVVTGALCAFYGLFVRQILRDGSQGFGALLFILAHAGIFFGVFSGGLLLRIVREWKTWLGAGIDADVAGLEVRHATGSLFVPWGEVQDIAMRDGRWEVAAGEQTFTFEPTYRHAAKLLDAIRQVLAARELGYQLPRLGAVSDAGLSLARDTEAAPERGLSRLEG